MNWTEQVKKPAIYARVSSEEQVEGTSLEDQVERCVKQAEVYGWSITKERIYVDDGYSGGSLNRPEIDRLRADIRAGKVDCVMVYKLDRLSRNIMDTVNLVLDEWQNENQVIFRSVSEDFNTNSPLGVLIFSILASFAQFERDVIRDRTSNGRIKRFKQGRRAVGDAPFGYDRGEINGTMVPNEYETELVRKIYKQYLQGMGPFSIATALNSAGYRTKKGRFWTETTVSRILKNQVYTGQVKYGGKFNEGSHEPIIDKETFLAVQELRKSRGFAGNRSVTSSFLLAGLVRCRNCGHMMFTQPASRGRRKHKDGSIYYTYNHSYYICGGRYKKGNTFCTCGHIQQDVLEEAVIEQVKAMFGERVATEETIQTIKAESEAQMQELTGAIQRLAESIRDKQSAIARWENAFETGSLDASRFKSRVERLEAEIQGLEEQIAETEKQAKELKAKQADVSWVYSLAEQVNKWVVLPEESKKLLLRQLIDHIEVWKPSLGRGKHREEPPVEIDLFLNRDTQAPSQWEKVEEKEPQGA